ncbi:hypothetical protein ACVFYP_14630 [Roseomonas sp. F4]
MRVHLILGFAVFLAIPASAQNLNPQPALRVTTDSTEYCRALAARLIGHPPDAEADQRLVEEGRRLCEDGHPRAGIAKLRRALRAGQPTR